MARIRVVLLTLLVSCAPPGTPTAEQVTPSVVDGQESARLFVDIVGAGDVLIMPRGIEHEGGYLYEDGGPGPELGAGAMGRCRSVERWRCDDSTISVCHDHHAADSRRHTYACNVWC